VAKNFTEVGALALACCGLRSPEPSLYDEGWNEETQPFRSDTTYSRVQSDNQDKEGREKKVAVCDQGANRALPRTACVLNV
jgi:hypothetical protein